MNAKNTILSTVVILSLILLGSCDEGDNSDNQNPILLRQITAGEVQIISSSNDFAFDIFSRINAITPDQNIFISPLSISTALSMTANGAVGETKEGIKKTMLQEGLTDDEINEAYKTLVDFITKLDPKVNLALANSNWYKQEYHIQKNFRDILLENYDAEVNAADFEDPGTKDLINAWIENKTNGKIKDMLDQIPSDAVMYLINAIYLKATWQYQFDKDKTKKMNFTLSDGSVKQTDMMFSEGIKVSYFANQDMEFIEIPYGNGQFVFTVLLPNDPNNLDKTIEDLDFNSFQNYINAADTFTYQVYLPKFKIEYKIPLNGVLSDMGMAQSFSDTADFSNMFDEELSLAISRVLHQSFIEVDEEGTEAAAATVVEIIETSFDPDRKTTVLIDRPFVFFIREKHSNSILFSGKLINP